MCVGRSPVPDRRGRPRAFEAAAKVARRLLLKDHWFLAVRRRSSGREDYRTTDGYRVLRPPRDRYDADPFVIKHEGHNYLFFEEFRFDHPKGTIACMRLDPDGCPVSREVVLERPYHLSFPFVFAWAGEIWMIPETSANRTIELYRSRRFPYEWTLERVLMTGVDASDTVLLSHDERYWLFTNLVTDHASAHESLFVFHGRSPVDTWTPHSLNPVVTDISRARSAGQIFEDHGALVRPGQDCSRRYGHAVQFSRLDLLNEHEYRETPLWRTGPDWQDGIVGTHTYNCNEDFEVRDAYAMRVDFYGKWLAIGGRVRRVLAGTRLRDGTSISGVE